MATGETVFKVSRNGKINNTKMYLLLQKQDFL